MPSMDQAGARPMTTKSRIHSFHPESYVDAKSAVRSLLHASGGEARAAARCRVSKSTLSEYGLPIRLSPTPTICSVHPFS